MNPVLAYHERSKHQLERYAPGPGGLDWATQPDPFRRYDGAPQIELPLLQDELPVSWDNLFSAPGPAPQAFDINTLGGLLELSFGLSAWKVYGNSRWALRCNPSSGNLHPTEAYLVCPELPGLPAGVYHYRPDTHSLERRAAAPFDWAGGVLLGLTGIHWREAWKYGLRAFRYCQHDCGHALAGLAYAAAVFGWPARRLDWADGDIGALSGVDRSAEFVAGEPESPEALAWLGPGRPPEPAAVLASLAGAGWAGRANRLSPHHLDWPDIPAINAATERPTGGPAHDEPRAPVAGGEGRLADRSAGAPPEHAASVAPEPARQGTAAALPPLPPASATPASRLIRRRRSAQAFDGISEMGAIHFQRLLDALLPRPGLPPWSLSDEPPEVHPVFFVHRVEGLAPGVYALPRCPAATDALRAAIGRDWLWERVAGFPDHLPLYLLAPLDVRGFAATSSCHQDIASDSAFAVAMLARFDDLAGERPAEAWRYRRRFHEAGLLGQVLYLEAEAGGLQGTGIGCYFDDVVHRALGIDTTRFQDLYHFTVGGALLDQRLGSETGYAFRSQRNKLTER